MHKLPIKILLSFIVFTEILFFIGPIKWNINNHLLLLLFFSIVNTALYLGYRKGLNINTVKQNISAKYINKLCLFVFLVTCLKVYFSFGSLSITTILTQVINGLYSPGDVYYDRNLQVNLGRFFILLLLSLPQFVGLVAGTCYWEKLSKKNKVLYVIIIFLEISRNLSIGVRKGIFDILILIIVGRLCAICQKGNIKSLQHFINTSVFVIFLFVVYFVYSTFDRFSQYTLMSDMLVELDIKDFYRKHIPDYLTMSLYFLDSYLGQGYYALAKSFEIGIILPNIITTNFFTINVAERFVPNIIDSSYLGILNRDYGIDPYASWHSIYVWIANGFTFFGVPFVIYLIGYCLAKTWMYSLYKRDLVSISLFVLHVQMVLYFFANNQVYSFSFVTIVGLFIWFVIRKCKRC